MRKALWTVMLILIPGLCLADSHKSIAEVWQCELKEGKEMKDVMANNKRWLAHTRKMAGTDEINSWSLQTAVGDLTKFVFIDGYPDMKAWAAAKSAEESEEGKAIEETFNLLMDCTKNRLYNATRT